MQLLSLPMHPILRNKPPVGGFCTEFEIVSPDVESNGNVAKSARKIE